MTPTPSWYLRPVHSCRCEETLFTARDAELVLEAEGRRRVQRSPPLVRLPRRVEEPRLREGSEKVQGRRHWHGPPAGSSSRAAAPCSRARARWAARRRGRTTMSYSSAAVFGPRPRMRPRLALTEVPSPAVCVSSDAFSSAASAASPAALSHPSSPAAPPPPKMRRAAAAGRETTAEKREERPRRSVAASLSIVPPRCGSGAVRQTDSATPRGGPPLVLSRRRRTRLSARRLGGAGGGGGAVGAEELRLAVEACAQRSGEVKRPREGTRGDSTRLGGGRRAAARRQSCGG